MRCFSGRGFPDEEKIVVAEQAGWLQVCEPAPALQALLASPALSAPRISETIGSAVHRGGWFA